MVDVVVRRARLRRLAALPIAAVALVIGAPAAVAATNFISTVAGNGSARVEGDGGPATNALLSVPVAVAETADGGFLIALQGSASIRRVSPGGTITTVAGNGTPGLSGDGGPATSAQLNTPNGVAPTADGGFLIADSQTTGSGASHPTGRSPPLRARRAASAATATPPRPRS